MMMYVSIDHVETDIDGAIVDAGSDSTMVVDVHGISLLVFLVCFAGSVSL